MNTIAARITIFAVGILALGTTAFAETPLTAKIPFAFRTIKGMLPAGTYEVREVSPGTNSHVMVFRNLATQESSLVGTSRYNAYNKAAIDPVIQFSCAGGECALKAIKTTQAALEFGAPAKPSDKEKKMEVVSVALKYQPVE